MPAESNIEKLKLARDKLADVYEDEVRDEVFDNGNLDNINNAVKFVEMAIRELNRREE